MLRKANIGFTVSLSLTGRPRETILVCLEVACWSVVLGHKAY